MNDVINHLENLFSEAKQRSEFEFVLCLINYRGMGKREEMTNLSEWFEAIEFYKELYLKHIGKEKTRIGALLYSTFFENSDFYNILGSLCRISLGYKGSTYLFYKTKKYERLLGTGEKIGFVLELLNDCNKENLILFFTENHFKEIRNTFFHSAYTLIGDDYILIDSDPIQGERHLNVNKFLYPKIENIIQFFDRFKDLYLQAWASYKENKVVEGLFPNAIQATILGSADGLKGFRINNSVSFYGKTADSGIFYDERFDIWAGLNIVFQGPTKEDVEIQESLTRYQNKPDISRSDSEFMNLVEKISERGRQDEINSAAVLLLKFGDIRYENWSKEQNQYKKPSLISRIIPYYQKAIDLNPKVDLTEVQKRMKELQQLVA